MIYGCPYKNIGHFVVAIVKFRYKVWKSVSPIASPRCADCRQYNNRNLHALYGNHLGQVSGYVVCVPRENECPYRKREGLCACVHIWDVLHYSWERTNKIEHHCSHRSCMFFSHALFLFLPRKKPRKPKNAILIQS